MARKSAVSEASQIESPVVKADLIPKSARTVVIACKIPQGIVLQLQRPVDRMEDTRDGPKPRTYWAFFGKRYWIAGPAYPVGTIPKGFPKSPLIEGGYALTRGIPAEVWNEWAEQNKRAPYFEKPDGAEHGMIFAYAEMESVADAAREQEGLLSGLEPISTEVDKDGKLVDPRLPHPITNSLAKIGYEPHPNAG